MPRTFTTTTIRYRHRPRHVTYSGRAPLPSPHLMRASQLPQAAKMSFKTQHRSAAKASAPLRKPPALAANFPKSTARPSSLFTFAGVTAGTTETVRRVLTENDHAYDMFELKRRFAHNHFAHSVLTRYSLGASSPLLQADWEYDRTYLAALDPNDDGRKKELVGMPDEITPENYRDDRWLGHKGAYPVYITFFHKEVERLGPLEAVKKYILSPEVNATYPKMMVALIAGAVHPMIHIGLGLEFGDNVVVAEGLAQACMHSLDNSSGLFGEGKYPTVPLPKPSKPERSLLGLYHEFTTDPILHPGPYDANKLINDRMRDALTPEHVAAIHDLTARWNLFDVSDKAMDARLEEVAWLATLLTGATSRPGRDMRIDFFLMHLLTSSLFLPTYVRLIPGEARRLVLQAWLLTTFHLSLIRGRPHIFADNAMGYDEYPAGPMKQANVVQRQAVGDGSAEDNNPWLEIVANALVANDSHVPKSIRALLYYSQKYGVTQKGGVPGAKEENTIPNLDKVDGTLFVRIAGKTMDYMGWTKEGQSEGDWDRSALGWDGAWELEGSGQTDAGKN